MAQLIGAEADTVFKRFQQAPVESVEKEPNEKHQEKFCNLMQPRVQLCVFRAEIERDEVDRTK